MSMSSSNKIHPIYVALDANQYSRAIKLCLAMPKDNLLAQALLAHAYNKSMQRYKAILVLQSIVGTEGFQELQLECKYAREAWDQQQATTNNNAHASTPAPQTQAAAKKGKKGKKKPSTAVPSAVSGTASSKAPNNSSGDDDGDQWSLAEHLSNPPTIDENWEKLPPTDQAITDEVSLSYTISIFFLLHVVLLT